MTMRYLLAAALAAAPFAASAADDKGLSYTYVEGGYTQARADNNDEFLGDFSADGGYLRGSFAVSPSFYVFGSYARGTDEDSIAIDFGGTRFDIDVEDELTQAEAGIGYRMPMGEKVDFLAELAYLRLDEEITASVDGESDSERTTANGGRFALGLRGGSEHLEGWVKLGYVDGGDFAGDFIGTLGAQYKFNRTWGLVGEVEIVDELTRYTAGVRASF
ncbi:hypothetical protein QLQ15_03375 [Lysobacter sp. LF1]|uniref:Outer membrane protein beta-barrel domain-containing protein n=1 Tax=Lysobacter stagni TaxID=3045172 RepID=A0ABT6XCR5_9GAMM|nr:outer membrane beta-barrel protein [Lysobacter sp. LF1]MDI9237944.1 hypothetical protein [Lysobacter sp. LF1]